MLHPAITIQININNEAEMCALSNKLASLLQEGDVIALHGNLGAGKTTFTRGLIRALLSAPEMDVPSPTFTLVLTYDGPNFPIWHYDMYRIEQSSELDELGFEETIDGLALIEWPSRMGDKLPQFRLDIEIEFTESQHTDNGRTVKLTGIGEDWKKRLANFS